MTLERERAARDKHTTGVTTRLVARRACTAYGLLPWSNNALS